MRLDIAGRAGIGVQEPRPANPVCFVINPKIGDTSFAQFDTRTDARKPGPDNQNLKVTRRIKGTIAAFNAGKARLIVVAQTLHARLDMRQHLCVGKGIEPVLLDRIDNKIANNIRLHPVIDHGLDKFHTICWLNL